MQVVKFPGLGLEFYLHRVAFKFIGIEVYWYAILISIAILIFFLVAKKGYKKYEIKYEDILDLGIILIPVSILSARLYYIVFNFSEYRENIFKVFDFRSGGLAIYGGIIGGIITVYIYCRKKKIQFLDLTDLIAPFLALGQSIGRWGNFINVEAYGMQTTLPWRMEIIENGKNISVHPAFLYESILTFIIFIVLILLSKKRKFKGEITYLYIILYSFIRFFIESIRIDSLMLYGIRISQVLSIVLFVVFCHVFIFNVIKSKKRENTSKK